LETIVIDTVRQHLEHGYTKCLDCPKCGRHLNNYSLMRLVKRRRTIGY